MNRELRKLGVESGPRMGLRELREPEKVARKMRRVWEKSAG